jgi:hypothetical protein
MKKITKEGLACCCGILGVLSIGSYITTLIFNNDNIAIIITGEVCKVIGLTFTAATFTYAGIYCAAFWNRRQIQRELEQSEDFTIFELENAQSNIQQTEQYQIEMSSLRPI